MRDYLIAEMESSYRTYIHIKHRTFLPEVFQSFQYLLIYYLLQWKKDLIVFFSQEKFMNKPMETTSMVRIRAISLSSSSKMSSSFSIEYVN